MYPSLIGFFLHRQRPRLRKTKLIGEFASSHADYSFHEGWRGYCAIGLFRLRKLCFCSRGRGGFFGIKRQSLFSRSGFESMNWNGIKVQRCNVGKAGTFDNVTSDGARRNTAQVDSVS
ncbi:hypothetical protein K443DRAFT_350314 [Laccaria amethystina LaAM-08-1]|uniref:Uncharacterized protein n=1 Tax=Laccaria amethystina LaAM-08-1 TaxID=1095629 RepID=A0A0C9WJI4_9AGAR|nr:hypothetical protein K443DRAFT_350314 [Laccaria amethystina LaAM-08-1]